MAALVPPGAPRPDNRNNASNQSPPPPNYNPIAQGNPSALADTFQHMNLNRRPSLPNSAPTPFPYSQAPPSFPSSALPPPGAHAEPPFSRPGPPPAALARPVTFPAGPPQASFPPNVAPVRPSGLVPSGQPSSFAPRPTPGPLPAVIGGHVAPTSGSPPPSSFPHSAMPSRPFAPPQLGARPSTVSSPTASGLSVPPSSARVGLVNNGPPAFGQPPFHGGPHVNATAAPSPSVGPSRMMPPAQAPYHAPTMRSVLTSTGVTPPVPLSQPPPPFSAPPQGVSPSGSPYAPTQAWPIQPGQVSSSSISDLFYDLEERA